MWKRHCVRCNAMKRSEPQRRGEMGAQRTRQRQQSEAGKVQGCERKLCEEVRQQSMQCGGRCT